MPAAWSGSSSQGLDAPQLLAMLDDVTTGPAIRDALGAMSAHFRETNADAFLLP